MVKASIDIGSNSVLLLIAEIDGKKITMHKSQSTITALGRTIDQLGCFDDVSMKETFNTLKKYKDICLNFSIEPKDVVVTATEASRVSTNAKDFFYKVYKEIGFRTDILTSEGEAYYSTQGILLDVPFKKMIYIMDIGGASTELICVNEKFEIVNSYSFPIGAVRVSSWIGSKNYENKMNEFLQDFKSEIIQFSCDELICVAGTMTSVCNIYLENTEFEESKVHNTKIKTHDLFDKVKSLEKMSNEVILQKYPFLGKRAQNLKGGILVAKMFLRLLKTKGVIISTYGLRYGTLKEGGVKDGFIYERL